MAEIPDVFYYFTTVDSAKDDIKNRHIKISEISKLNDPFEFYCEDFSDERVKNGSLYLKKSVSEKYGIICFSEDWQHPLMWAHYANRSTGICLGFKFQDNLKPRKVKYVKSRTRDTIERINKGQKTKPEDLIKIYSTKFDGWSYEKEYRSLIELDHSDKNENGLYFVEFGTAIKLVEVILGLACNITPSEVQIWLNDYEDHIKISETTISLNEFKIIKKKH
ncbi:DUF2971 domain-containing protein [Pseudaquidulcibacter saccharophilus]|uniref:DUF2971 domain-containing protein n=1 Tax=Pseudaquidulcibacter saccharophilus TaxID=2831900 RepID=UPI001EFEFE00|nr:DUF2971 domain-containing protein [Pseudaquidulcibacter saccharophilus]